MRKEKVMPKLTNSQQKSTKGTAMAMSAFALMICTIFSKILGFAREMVLTYKFGSSNITDAYSTAYQLPSVVFNAIAVGFLTTYIPIYTKVAKKGPEAAKKFNSNVLFSIVLLSVAVIGAFYINPDFFVKILAPGYTGSKFEMTVNMSKVMIFSIFFISVTNILTGYLQYHKNFIVPGIVGIPYNLIVIVCIYLSTEKNYILLALGVLMSYIFWVMLLTPFAFKKGFRIKPYLNYKEEGIRDLFIMLMPVVLGLSVTQLNGLVDGMLSSYLGEGARTALGLGMRLNGFVSGIFVLSITTAIYPQITKYASEKKFDSLKKVIRKSLGSISLLVMPLSIGAIVLAKPVVIVLFMRGKFSQQAVDMTSIALTAYSVGMLAYAFKDLFNRAFYSMGDSKTPMINSVIHIVLNVILDLSLIKFLGIAGLALATSISAFLTAAFLIFRLRKRIGKLGLRAVFTNILKMFVSALAMGVAARLLYDLIYKSMGGTKTSVYIALAAAIALGALVYLILVTVLKVSYMKDVIDIIKNKFSRKKSNAARNINRDNDIVELDAEKIKQDITGKENKD